MAKSIYKSRPIKRKRRTKAEMEALKGGLYAILHGDHPQTVRGVFYQATVRGLIDKTEPDFKVVQRCLADMRRSGILPFNYIADSTRWIRKPTTHSDIEAFLFDAWQYYRRAIWDSQADYVEVWMEKDAPARVIYEVTAEWDVPLMVTRGSTDLRKAINGLSMLVEQAMGLNPFSGDLFVFCNRRQNIIKILYWDENGFCLWHKRLEEHRFKWPQLPEQVLTINRKQLSWLLAGLDFSSAHQRLYYQNVA